MFFIVCMDRDQIWPAYADKSGNYSNLKKVAPPCQGASGGNFRGSKIKKSRKYHKLPKISIHLLTPTPRHRGLGFLSVKISKVENFMDCREILYIFLIFQPQPGVVGVGEGGILGKTLQISRVKPSKLIVIGGRQGGMEPEQSRVTSYCIINLNYSSHPTVWSFSLYCSREWV